MNLRNLLSATALIWANAVYADPDTIFDPLTIARQENPTAELEEERQAQKKQFEERKQREEKIRRVEADISNLNLCIRAYYKSFRTGLFGSDRDWAYVYNVHLVRGENCKGAAENGNLTISNIRAGSSVLVGEKRCPATSECHIVRKLDNESGNACFTVRLDRHDYSWQTDVCGFRHRGPGPSGLYRQFKLYLTTS
ncbi:hypothetical protein J7382_06580 [Shimia sp. R11_0]|uniref:hypothetical protein n=1 Tax=Shimia sp. R11_0 TaxID=2821096 RepID=UPI001ADA771E|nr:hypothetical protein [Shimia sp. R11_0]MBO9477193.1 hypothetical protein [Shimia sp. R11_0]